MVEAVLSRSRSASPAVVATWVAALSVSGYPVVGLLSAALGIGDDSLSILFRLLVVFLCALTLPGMLERLAPSGWLYALLLVMTLYAVRLVYDYYILGIDDSMTHLTFFLATGVAPMLAIAHGPPIRERPLALALLVLGALFAVLALLVQLGLLSGGRPVISVDIEGRFQVERLNPISIGQAAVVLITAVFTFLKLQKLRPRNLIIGLLLIAASFYLLAASGSRSPFLGFVLVILVLVVREKAPTNYIALLAGAAIASVTVEWTTLFERFGAAADRSDQSSEERIRLAMFVLERPAEWLVAGAFHIDPSAGTGEYVHNLTLDVMLSLGLLVAILFHCILFKTLVCAWKESRSSAAILLLLLLQSLLHATFSGAMYSNTALWILMAAVLRRAQYLEEEARARPRYAQGAECGET